MTDIDLHTTLRGPLADKLLAIAATQDKPPVDILADFLVSALEQDLLAHRLNKYPNLVRERDRAVADYRRLVRLLPLPGSITFIPASATLTALNAAAARYKLPVDELVLRLIACIATDDLFDAVLDSK